MDRSKEQFHSPNLGGESEAHWFPHQLSVNQAETFALDLRKQRVDFEEKLINVRQEVVKLHQEVLAMKELLLKVTEDHSRIRPILDDRKRNALLRRHQPFPFTAEHTHALDARPNGSSDKKE